MELKITQRELKEIHLAMLYSSTFNHGTDGHNRLNLIAKFAIDKGFMLVNTGEGMEVRVPANVDVVEDRARP